MAIAAIYQIAAIVLLELWRSVGIPFRRAFYLSAPARMLVPPKANRDGLAIAVSYQPSLTGFVFGF